MPIKNLCQILPLLLKQAWESACLLICADLKESAGKGLAQHQEGRAHAGSCYLPFPGLGSPSSGILPGQAHSSRLGLSLGKAFPKWHPKSWWARIVKIRMLTCPHRQKERGCQLLLEGRDKGGGGIASSESSRYLEMPHLYPAHAGRAQVGTSLRTSDTPVGFEVSLGWLRFRPQAWAPGLAGSRAFLDLSFTFHENRDNRCPTALQ